MEKNKKKKKKKASVLVFPNKQEFCWCLVFPDQLHLSLDLLSVSLYFISFLVFFF